MTCFMCCAGTAGCWPPPARTRSRGGGSWRLGGPTATLDASTPFLYCTAHTALAREL